MEALNTHDTFQVFLHKLDINSPSFALPFEGEEYTCLVAILDIPSEFDDEKWELLACHILNSGCNSWTTWELGSCPFSDTLLKVNWDRSSDDDLQDEYFVMSAWFSEPSPTEAVDHFFQCSDFGETIFSNYLILLVGANEERESRLRIAIDKELADAKDFSTSMSDDFRELYLQRLCEKRRQ